MNYVDVTNFHGPNPCARCPVTGIVAPAGRGTNVAQRVRQASVPSSSGQGTKAWHTLQTARSMTAYGRALSRAAQAAIDPPGSSVRVWWAEHGEPQLIYTTPDELDTGWASPTLRASALRDHATRVVPSRTTVGRAVGLYGLSSGGSRGVLEVQAGRVALDQAADELVALAAFAAPLPPLVESRRREALMAAAFELGNSLSTSMVPDDAARKVVRFLAGSFDTAVVVWRADEATDMHLVGQSGVPVHARQTLNAMRVNPRWDSLTPAERALQRTAVEELIGGSVDVYTDEHLVLFAGAVARPEAVTAAMATAFLVHALSRVGSRVFEAATQRQLDLSVAVASHEIRSPLLGVEGALGILMGRATLSPADRDLLRRARGEVRRVLSETKHLLVPTSGRGVSTRRRMDLLSVTRTALKIAREASEGAEVAVRGERDLFVIADAASLRRAVTNIVRNALVHASGGPINIVVARDGEHGVIRVSDVGPGIPRQERDRVFDPFVRGSTGRKVEGSGLGLFVARLAVESHGGSLTLRSGPRGSTFTIRLPLAGRGPSSSAS
jgi:signal transduction histidine kinase